MDGLGWRAMKGVREREMRRVFSWWVDLGLVRFI